MEMIASLTQAGDILVTNGARGIVTDGAGNKIQKHRQRDRADANSVGFVIDGERNVFNNKGNIDVNPEWVLAQKWWRLVTGDAG